MKTFVYICTIYYSRKWNPNHDLVYYIFKKLLSSWNL